MAERAPPTSRCQRAVGRDRLEAADAPPLCTPRRDVQSLRSTQPPSFHRAAALASELALALAAAGHGLAYPYRSMEPSSGRPYLKHSTVATANSTRTAPFGFMRSTAIPPGTNATQDVTGAAHARRAPRRATEVPRPPRRRSTPTAPGAYDTA
jgi:hypothetical protein